MRAPTRAREKLHGFLFCTFKIEVQKKGRSPRTIRNYLVILLGNAGRLRLMKGAFECSQRCIKWKSQPILQQHLLRTKLYVIISPIVY